MNKLDLNYNLKKTAGATARNNTLCTLSNTEKNVVIDYSILQELNLSNITMDVIIEELKKDCSHLLHAGYLSIYSNNQKHYMLYEAISINVRDNTKIKYYIVKITAIQFQIENMDKIEVGTWTKNSNELYYRPEMYIA